MLSNHVAVDIMAAAETKSFVSVNLLIHVKIRCIIKMVTHVIA